MTDQPTVPQLAPEMALELAALSLASRGGLVWAESLMRQRSASTLAGDAAYFARLWSTTVEEAVAVLSELDQAGLFRVQKDADGKIVTVSSYAVETELKAKKREAQRRQGYRRLEKTGKDVTNWRGVMAKWNQIAQKYGYPCIQTMTSGRKKHYLTRLRERPDFWDIVEREMAKLDHSFAQQGNWMGFDFLVKSDNNLAKFAEGKYRKKHRAPQIAP